MRWGRSGRWSLLLGCALALLGAGCDRDQLDPVALPIGTELGQLAPPLEGELPDGTRFLHERGAGPATVLVFYRGAECGLCRVQLETIERNLGAYRQSGARILALTLDPPATSLRLLAEEPLSFPLVSVEAETFVRWGALDRGSSQPLPASYVLDPSGVVRFRHIGRNASDRVSDAELIAILDDLSNHRSTLSLRESPVQEVP